MLLTWHGGLALIKNETPQDVDANVNVERASWSRNQSAAVPSGLARTAQLCEQRAWHLHCMYKIIIAAKL